MAEHNLDLASARRAEETLIVVIGYARLIEEELELHSQRGQGTIWRIRFA
jgi:hypothetical protein